MARVGSNGAVIRFGAFEANLRSGELRKNGIKLKLGDQPFSVLAILLKEPGDLVTREDLQKRLWPEDTFVDFDRGLNKAINRLREALGDSADSPCFIETLPKRGYRFIGIVDEPIAQSVSDAISHDTAPGEPANPVTGRRFMGIGLAALALTACGIGIWLLKNRAMPSGDGSIIRSSLLPPPNTTFVPYSFALSPNGRYLAFVAETPDGSSSLWVRTLSTATAIMVAGTSGASFPFWSPDERHIGFFADSKLKTVDVAGEAISILADVRRPSGGTWGKSGVIVYAPDVNGPLYKVADTGGTPVPIAGFVEAESAHWHRWPVFLPDGRHFLYVELSSGTQTGDTSGIRAGSIDSTEDKQIGLENVRTIAFAIGHIFFVKNGVLYAQRFDDGELRTVGEPTPVTDRDVAGPSVYYPSEFSISHTGILAFQSSADLASRLLWFDSTGKEMTAFDGPRFFDPELSPDGTMLAGSCDQSNNGMLAVCIHDFARGVTSRVTPGPNDRFPVWSHDGQAIAYLSNGAIYRMRADGSGKPVLASNRGIPTGWAADGRILSFGTYRGVVSLAVTAPTTSLPRDLGPGAEGQLSPDSQWLAYIGRDGLLIQRFPELSNRVLVTNSGASQPRWSRNGRQLFYISSDKKIMAVDFDRSQATVSAPRTIAQTRIVASALTGFQYDVAPDGRFLVNSFIGDRAPLSLMTGWTKRLQQ